CRHAAPTRVRRWPGFGLNSCGRRTPLERDTDLRQRSSAPTKRSAMGEEQAAQAFKLSDRQRRIMSFIRMSLSERGYPPTMREIGEAVGLSSPSSVKYQLQVLEEKGLLRRDPISTRAIEIIGEEYAPTSLRGVVVPTQDGAASVEPALVPIVGRIAAGGPILAEQAIEDVFPLPQQLVGDGELFLLRVVGDSMIDAAICDGDWVVVR